MRQFKRKFLCLSVVSSLFLNLASVHVSFAGRSLLKNKSRNYSNASSRVVGKLKRNSDELLANQADIKKARKHEKELEKAIVEAEAKANEAIIKATECGESIRKLSEAQAALDKENEVSRKKIEECAKDCSELMAKSAESLKDCGEAYRTMYKTGLVNQSPINSINFLFSTDSVGEAARVGTYCVRLGESFRQEAEKFESEAKKISDRKKEMENENKKIESRAQENLKLLGKKRSRQAELQLIVSEKKKIESALKETRKKIIRDTEFLNRKGGEIQKKRRALEESLESAARKDATYGENNNGRSAQDAVKPDALGARGKEGADVAKQGPRFETNFLGRKRLRDGDLVNSPKSAATGKAPRPIRAGGRVSSPYGGKRRHKGVDICAAINTPIYASFPGKVIYVGHTPYGGGHGGYGICVDYVTPDGIMIRCAHMSRANVKVGQQVNVGDIIGFVGNTTTTDRKGNLTRSGTPHLHIETHVGGRPVNPAGLIGL